MLNARAMKYAKKKNNLFLKNLFEKTLDENKKKRSTVAVKKGTK